MLEQRGDPVELVCIRLMRSGLGVEEVGPAVANARAMVCRERARVSAHVLLPLIELDLGVAETWLGDLAAAEVNLSAALMASRAHDLPLLTVEVLTHLAVTQYLMGRERACLALTDEARALTSEHGWLPPGTVGRGTIVAEIAR